MESKQVRPRSRNKPSSPWLRCPYPRASASQRLVCFAHAGGAASAYHKWGTLVSEELEVWAVELPGRGSRFGEPTEPRLEAAAQAIAQALTQEGITQKPFAFFGHSLGGLLAYEVARALQRSSPLKHLFVSACHAPQHKRQDAPIHALQDEEFLATMVQRYAGIPAELLREKELLELLLPALRADMAMIECYEHRACEPLSCPITALVGDRDLRVSAEVLKAWRQQSQGVFEVLSFPGGHFYLQNAVSELLASVEAKLLRVG